MGKPLVLTIFSLSVAAFSAQMTTIQLTGGQHRYIRGQYWYTEHLNILKHASVQHFQVLNRLKMKH